ncbi:hypothetical protein QL285_080419 [Trifolium repens]|nr:hypothetical protein QL285_080419 [Trifolium repens]
MTWYMKISHPYSLPLPVRNWPRADLDAVINEEVEAEAEAEGKRTPDLVATMSQIRQPTHALMASGKIPQASLAYLTIYAAE